MPCDNVGIDHSLETRIRISLIAPMTVVSVGDRIHELLGFKAEDFITGKVSLKDRIHAHDQNIADDLFSTGTDQTSGTFNIRVRQANGRIRCIKGHYTKEPDASDTDITLELLVQDAKSLRQNYSEQPITASFRAMMENTDDYIYSKDRNHVFTGASQTLVAITSPAEHWTDLLGLTDYDVFPEGYVDIYYRLEKQVFADIRVAHEIQETLDNDGNKGWVDNRKYPIYDDDDGIIGLFGIARVITERKLAEEKLLQFKRTLDQTLDCVFMFRQDDFRFTYVNEGAKQQVGYTEAELLNMTPLDIKPEFTLERFQQMARLLIDGTRLSHNFQTIHRHKNGQDIPVEIALQFVRTEGQESRFVAIVRDITERRQTEEMLRRSERSCAHSMTLPTMR